MDNTHIQYNITNPRLSPMKWHYTYFHTVWPKPLAGRYFGGLLKMCHLAEFTLGVEPVLAIMIFITKWLIERAGNLTEPWASFCSARMKIQLKTRQIVVTLNLDCSRCVCLYSDHVSVVWIAFLALTDKPTPLPPPVYKTLWRNDTLVRSFQWWTPCWQLDWRV